MASGRRTTCRAEQITQDDSELGENQPDESHPTQHEESHPEMTPGDEPNSTLRPLLSEVESHTKKIGKNLVGAKKWTCKH